MPDALQRNGPFDSLRSPRAGVFDDPSWQHTCLFLPISAPST